MLSQGEKQIVPSQVRAALLRDAGVSAARRPVIESPSRPRERSIVLRGRARTRLIRTFGHR
jgi:hypothetical protein